MIEANHTQFAHVFHYLQQIETLKSIDAQATATIDVSQTLSARRISSLAIERANRRRLPYSC